MEMNKKYFYIGNCIRNVLTNLLRGEGLHVRVGPVGDGGVGVCDRLERLGVALDDAGGQLHLGRL